ncbi:unnamed protein product [Ectocarpus sp. CCAP 1310/34]|nr:unnamed protein product [Ectocarpus sp. CCAP 1310/34]
MRRCRELGHLRRWSSIVVPKSARRTYSEYAPAAPSPNDLKAPLPEKYSVGKNLKLKAVLFQYDLLAGSNNERKSITASSSPSSSSIPGAPASPSTSFDPLTPSGENLVEEITGVLGKGRGDRLQELGRALIADLKDKMGAAVDRSSAPAPPAKQQREHQLRASQDSDPKAKYMEKLRKKTGAGSSSASPAATAGSQSGGDADLFAARNLVSNTEAANLQSAWMLRQGAGDLLTYLAARSLRLGVIAGPQTSPREFESFVRQLRQQSIRLKTTVSPEDLELDGVEAGVVRASRELGMGEGGVGGADVLLVGSSNPLLSAATEANMFTARYYPPNSRREGVIQTFVVRDIDEVRTVVEQVNGVSFRS